MATTTTWKTIGQDKRKRPPRTPQGVASGPVEIAKDDWYNRFDPIDKEVYAVLVCFYPNPLDSETILEKLQWMNPHENKYYKLHDVWDSLDLCLKPYLVESSKNTWTLASRTPKPV